MILKWILLEETFPLLPPTKKEVLIFKKDLYVGFVASNAEVADYNLLKTPALTPPFPSM